MGVSLRSSATKRCVPRPHPLLRSKELSQFQGLKAGNGAFTVLIEAFTVSTFILVVTPPGAHDEATLLNVAAARPQFDALIATI